MEARIDPHPPIDSLKAFSLGLLDDAPAHALYLHLEGCAPCRRRAEEASGDDFLDRLQKARASNSTPAPAGQLPPLPGIAKPAGPGGTLLPDPARSLFDASAPTLDPADPSAPADLPPELAANAQYEVVRELGRGGMGVVYLARNRQMDRLEVLKVVNRALLERPGTADRFLREIRSAAALEHRNVVRAYACLKAGKLLALVMEYVEGEDLARLVDRRGPLSVSSACSSVIQAARGLQEAHEKGMVHRDIKPQNLLLSRKLKEVMILDFGLAKVASEKGVEQGLTAEGRMLGTPGYVAPEQIRDAASADIRADIYSLGCTMYYLLTGRPPFDAPNLFALLHAHQFTDADPLDVARPNVPAGLAAAVARMMAKDPAKRYQTPAEVAAALAPFVKGGKPAAPAPLPAPPRPAKQEPKTPSLPPPLPAHVRVELVPAPAVGRTPFDLGDAPAPAASRERKKNRGALVALALALLVPLAVGVAIAVFLLETPNGTLIVEINDPDVEARIKGGKLILTGPDGKTSYLLTAADRNSKRKVGEYKIRVQGADGLALDTTEFTLKKGGVVKVRVALRPPLPDSLPSPKKGDVVTNSIGMKLVYIPPGKFSMGSPKEEVGRRDDEGPEHEVEITTGFYMGVYEVTQGEYQKLMGINPSEFAAPDRVRFPVEQVSREDAVKFCETLSTQELKTTQKRKYRLPTEAEWEYACRGGASPKTVYYFGNSLSAEQANFDQTEPKRVREVGSYRPNGFGLYDMHGNVGEWCIDWYDKDYYSKSPEKNPQGPVAGTFGVTRGGCWFYSRGDCRSADRHGLCRPTARHGTLGFRVVMVPSGSPGTEGVSEPKASLDSDRRAAEYVLSIGGVVRVNDEVDDTRTLAELPKEAFRLTHVDLARNPKLRNAGLAAFSGCKNLKFLSLHETQAKDVGLAYFKECKDLEVLELGSTQLSDAGLAHFKDCKKLKRIGLNFARITEAGLASFAGCKDLNSISLFAVPLTDTGLGHLKGCTNLEALELEGAPLTDAGLAHLQNCKKLVSLHLLGTQVTDNGLILLKNCKDLQVLSLAHTKVTDAGLAHFKDCKSLVFLRLQETAMTDKGLAYFKGCDKLRQFDLGGTKITRAGLADFRKALPKCNIPWEGPPEPKAALDPEHKPAEFVPLFNGKDLTGWEVDGACKEAEWKADANGIRIAGGPPPTWGFLLSKKKYTNFVLRMQFQQMTEGAKSGIIVRGIPRQRFMNLPYQLKINLRTPYDTGAVLWSNNSVYQKQTAQAKLKPALEWNDVEVELRGQTLRVTVNGVLVQNMDLASVAGRPTSLPALAEAPGRIGLQKVNGDVAFRNIEVKELPAKGKAAALDPDRKAAEYVLSAGGAIRVNDENRDIRAAADLPKEAFRLTWVDLHSGQVNDGGFEAFKGCKNLAFLQLRCPNVGDAGLIHFKDCKRLKNLELYHTKITDQGLEAFGGRKELIVLCLNDCRRVGDAGMIHFKGCNELIKIELPQTKVTDAGMTHFKGCKKLIDLRMAETQVSDAGLANISESALLLIDLNGCRKVTDVGLARLPIKMAKVLWLSGTAVGDKTLARCKDCEQLDEMNLNGTKVTAAGVADLEKALPKCRIVWDGPSKK